MNPQEPTPEIKIQKQNKFEELVKKLGWKKIIAGGVVVLILILAIFVSLGLAIINQQNYKISISSPVSLSYPSYPKKPVSGIIKDFDYLYVQNGQLIAGFTNKEAQAFDLPQEYIVNFEYSSNNNLIVYTNGTFYKDKTGNIDGYLPSELYVLNLKDDSIKQLISKNKDFGKMCSEGADFLCNERFIVPAYKFNNNGTKLAYVYDLKSYIYDFVSEKSYELKDATFSPFVVREFIWSENDDIIAHSYYEGEVSTVFRYRNGNYSKIALESKLSTFNMPNYVISAIYPHYGAEGFNGGQLLTTLNTSISPVSYFSYPVSRTVVNEDKTVPYVVVWDINMDNGKAKEIYNNNKEERTVEITSNGNIIELLPTKTLNVYKGTQKINSVKIELTSAYIMTFSGINDYVLLITNDGKKRLLDIFTGASYSLDQLPAINDDEVVIENFQDHLTTCIISHDYLSFDCDKTLVIDKKSKSIVEL